MNKNILIVDDNKNNRLTLQFILEDWEEENPETKLELDFAEDGKVAVDMSAKKQYDIILMDIMMPNMDGIEATKLIRASGANSLIIACSALSDNEHKNMILEAGAEDYLTKPISSELFIKRFSTYLNLAQKRQEKSYNVDAENVINSDVYHRKTIFTISDEISLSEFWEYFLLQNSFSEREEFTDMIRFIYGLGNYQVKQNYKFHIFFEESIDSYYITMDNILLLQPTLVDNLEKNYNTTKYKIAGNKLSFNFSKKVLKNEEKVQELQVYDFIDSSDISILKDTLQELKVSTNKIGMKNIDEEDVLVIKDHVNDIANILSSYVEVYLVSDALHILSIDISQNVETFITFSNEISDLCSDLHEDLTIWLEKLFVTGAPSIDFLDSSIISNANMISSFIKDLEEVEDEEGMFDF